VGAPRLLLLDEPTTGLDPRSRNELWEAIRALVGSGTDVLLTTQYLDEADQLAHHIVVIDHGKVIAAGTPAELKTQAGRDVVEIHAHDARGASRVRAPEPPTALGRSPQPPAGPFLA
jgi:ABC-type multidrug transport system ATPase subunit